MKKYNVGIIGYGWVATAHIPAINASGLAQVTAVHSSRPQDGAALSAKYGSAIQTFTDLDAMLKRPDIHAVSICSYPSQHAQHLIAAARAGKHIILEKPLCLSLEESKAMLSEVAKAGVKTCVCFECRYSSQFLSIKAMIDSGLLGTLHYGEVESVTSYATRSKNAVFAQYEYPTSSVSILKFSGGRIGKVASVIDCIQPYYFHTHLVGSEGSLLDNKFHSNRIGGLNKHAWSNLSMKMLDSGDVSDHPYQTQFDAFFNALDRGEEMPLTSLRESMKSHFAVLAADRSAELGREVKMSELA